MTYKRQPAAHTQQVNARVWSVEIFWVTLKSYTIKFF